MGVVYRAFDRRHDRTVAVKALEPAVATLIGRQLFLREIAIAAKLAHPNILPIHDSGAEHDVLYYVMPFVDGGSLREVLREAGPMALAPAMRILSDVADALSYAHDHGVVHLDIKPANILMLSGRAVIADFGIATVSRSDDQPLTDASSRRYLGTPAYMSPEQRIDQRVVDQRSDIYSLGVVALELLTGNRSLPSPHDRLLGASGRPIPRRTERAIRRALQVAPHHRFQTAAQFADAIAWQRRWSPPLLALTGLSAVALTVAVGATVRFLGRAPASSARAPVRVVVAQFDNRTADASKDRIGMMASDWITEGLQRTGVVGVVPSPTAIQAFRFVRRDASASLVASLARETGADVVVTGSYYQTDDSLTIHVQVSDSTGRTQLGAITPVRMPLNAVTRGLEQVRTRLMGLLAARLDARLESAVRLASEPPTYEAYSLYTEALAHYVANEFEKAGQGFVGSYRADSTLTAALLMASISSANLGRYPLADSLLALLSPRVARLTAHDRLWFTYRAELLRGNRPGALGAIRQLAALAPGTKATYNWAVEAMQNGELTEARRALQSLNPTTGPMREWAPFWDVLGRIEHRRDDHVAELKVADRARIAFPNRLYLTLTTARALAALGRTAELRALLGRAQSMVADPMGTSYGEVCVEALLELQAHAPNDQAWVATSCLDWYAKHPPASAAQRSLHTQLLLLADQPDLALQAAAELVRLHPERPEFAAWLHLSQLRLGDTASATAGLLRLAAPPAEHQMGVVTLAAARVAAALGQTDRAIELITRALQEGMELDLWVHREPAFARLRRDPRYRTLTERRSR
jgi:hypothetical protein